MTKDDMRKAIAECVAKASTATTGADAAGYAQAAQTLSFVWQQHATSCALPQIPGATVPGLFVDKP